MRSIILATVSFRLTKVALLALTLGTALLASGCLRAITDVPLEIAPQKPRVTKQAELPKPDAAEQLTLEDIEQLLSVESTRPDADTNLPTAVVVDGWYRVHGTEEEWTCAPGQFRWQHNGLTALVKSPGDYSTALRTGLKSELKYVRAAAQIGLARLYPTKSARPLTSIVRNKDLTLSVRRAAVETLARSTVLETEADLRSLVEQLGPNEQDLIPEPLLYAEVLVGLARHVSVDEDPLFIVALTVPQPEVQLAVLSLWSAAPSPQLPEEIAALTKSPSAPLRCAALRALASNPSPMLLDQLQEATTDTDLQVRVTAIELLGKVHQREAIVLLQTLARDQQERHREAAFTALVQQQEWEIVQQVTQDTSYRVRMAVAIALAKEGKRERVPLAQQLVKDSSAMVQAKLCETLATWPPDIAVPLLFEGLASNNLLTRETAQKSLQAQQVDVTSFYPSAQPPERNKQLAALRAEWQQLHPTSPIDTVVATTGQATLDEVTQLIKQLQTPGDKTAQWIARKRLERMGKPILPVLDELVAQQRVTLEETTYRELLVGISPSFALIERLRSSDVQQRRNVARDLAQQAKLEPLSRLALERLARVEQRESDALVWNELLRAVSYSPGAHELALAALGHGETDVRRGGCDYLATYGDKRQAEALAPLLDDRDPVVRKAALVALGRCGPLRKREAVHALLGHSDIHMQVAAAQTLARWNDERGAAALERMVISATPASRRLAIAAMAELEDARFVGVLVQALDDQPSVQLAALTALPKVAGEDPLQQASPLPTSAADKARAWQAWYAKR